MLNYRYQKSKIDPFCNHPHRQDDKAGKGRISDAKISLYATEIMQQILAKGLRYLKSLESFILMQ